MPPTVYLATEIAISLLIAVFLAMYTAIRFAAYATFLRRNSRVMPLLTEFHTERIPLAWCSSAANETADCVSCDTYASIQSNLANQSYHPMTSLYHIPCEVSTGQSSLPTAAASDYYVMYPDKDKSVAFKESMLHAEYPKTKE